MRSEAKRPGHKSKRSAARFDTLDVWSRMGPGRLWKFEQVSRARATAPIRPEYKFPFTGAVSSVARLPL